MKINLYGKNLELTEAIEDYVQKRVTNLDKMLSKIEARGEAVMVNFEVSKSTNHHKAGEVFHADCLIKIDGKEFYASADKEDLYQAIDEVKASLFAEMSRDKGKRLALFHRGARKIKDALKGIRNWKK
ncbi:MAG: ribosome-associated translation inhibitor RaiA [bacterium]